MRNKYSVNHVLLRDDVFYCVKRALLDLAEHYSVKRLHFSLRTKSFKSAIHASKSVSQRLHSSIIGFLAMGMTVSTLKRLFTSIIAIVNKVISEHDYECSNAFSKTFFQQNRAYPSTNLQLL